MRPPKQEMKLPKLSDYVEVSTLQILLNLMQLRGLKVASHDDRVFLIKPETPKIVWLLLVESESVIDQVTDSR